MSRMTNSFPNRILNRSGAQKRKSPDWSGGSRMIAAKRASRPDFCFPVDSPYREKAARVRAGSPFPSSAGRARTAIRAARFPRVSAIGVPSLPGSQDPRSSHSRRYSHWGNNGGASPRAGVSIFARGRSLPAKTKTTGLRTLSLKSWIARRLHPPSGFFWARPQPFPPRTGRMISNRPMIPEKWYSLCSGKGLAGKPSGRYRFVRQTRAYGYGPDSNCP